MCIRDSDYRVPFQDYKVLLATVVVAPSAPNNTNNKGASPVILPYNGREPTISAVALAANAITADNIVAGTITTDHLSFTPMESDGDHDGGTVGGWNLNSSHIYSPSGSTPVTTGYTAGAGYINFNSAGSIHTPEFYVNTDGTAGFKGTMTAGGGALVLDSNGLTITAEGGTNYLTFKKTSDGGPVTGQMNSFRSDPAYGASGLRLGSTDGMHLTIGTQGQSTDHLTRVINLDSDYLSILPRGEADAGRQYYRFPIDTAAAGDVLEVQNVTSESSVAGNVSKNVVNLRWSAGGGGGGVSLTGSTNDAIPTVTGTNALTAESTLTYDATNKRLEVGLGGNLGQIGWANNINVIYSYYHVGGNGSAAYPAFSFLTDYSLGFYRPYQNEIAMAINATQKYKWASSFFRPNGTSNSTGVDLGFSTGRWDDIYADNNVIQTSDRRLKKQITPVTLGLDFINDLKPVTFKWKNENIKRNVAHYGLIAQDIIETLDKHGITDLEEFGGITGSEEETYGATYTEFVSILIKSVQELSCLLYTSPSPRD